MRNAKLKRVCQAGIMIGSLLLGLVSHSAHAQLNRTNTQTPIAETTTPQYQKVIYVNPALGKDEPNAGHSNSPWKLLLMPHSKPRREPQFSLLLAAIRQRAVKCSPLVIKQGVVLKGDESNLGQNIVITGGDRYISPTFERQNVAVLAER